MSALRWIGAIATVALLAPVLFYVVSGSLIGLVLPCSPEAGLEVLTVEQKQVTVSCAAVGLLVKTGTAAVGTATLTFCVFLMGVADLGASSRGP